MRPSSEALKLGQALVEQLKLDDQQDLLARWIANDIAVKMDAARAPDATAETRQDCADAIYALWSHRADLPQGRRPLEDLENVVQLLRDIDPSSPRSYYFQPTQRPGNEDNPWLQAAMIFDQMARTLIVRCLQRAAEGQGLAPSAWVEMAEASGLAPAERAIVKILFADEEDETPEAEILREGDRLKRLRANLARFRKGAALVDADLRSQLGALGPMPPRPKVKRERRSRRDSRPLPDE